MITLPHPLIPTILLALLTTPLASQDRCATPSHRDFDFWVGDWAVHATDGRQVGTNSIQPILGGCVLHERYSTPSGYQGESFNIYDAGRAVWHQSWVDNGGLLLRLEGGVDDGAMVMEGVTVAPDGTETLNRITWTVLDATGDRVRQHWETSTDQGESWSTAFDGEYRRTDPESSFRAGSTPSAGPSLPGGPPDPRRP